MKGSFRTPNGSRLLSTAWPSQNGSQLARSNARKQRDVPFLERYFSEAIAAGKIRKVDPKVAAFAFLGAVNWIYKWFRSDGQIPEEQLVRGMQDIFFGGLESP